MITHHTQLLNALIEKYNLKSYLEIGVNDPRGNFDKVKCEFKVGVDPDVKAEFVYKTTSDEYFKSEFTTTFDLIFIDGLHHADQVKRDFENSLRCLSDNGFIVIHDVLPENEAGTKVPRETKQWWGDVYKFAMDMNNYPVSFKTFDIDNGCMLVWKDNDRKNYNGRIINANWNDYLSYGHTIMNVTSTVEI
jgi:SAM-dependent methyltransferase